VSTKKKHTMNTNETVLPELKLHHIAVVVENIQESMANYAVLFGKENISEVMTVDTSKVLLCLIKIADEVFLELVQPMGEESSVYNLLKKRTSYYHMAYKVKDIHDTVARLEKLNYKPLNFFKSSVFQGKLCIFIYTPEAHMIELIEE